LNTIRAVLSDIKIKRVAAKIKKELDLLLTDLSRLSDRAGNVARHFGQIETDIEQLQTSVSKITPRAEKLRDMDFGED
jgi:DNA recombination protein RmuC